LLSSIKIDQIVRSHRKTIGLQITKDARLIVRAPHATPVDFINQLIQRKEKWIKNKQDYFRNRQEKIKPKRFAPGEEFLYLGENYPLTLAEDLPKAIVFDNNLMISSLVLGNAKDHLEGWYKSQAAQYMHQRVEYYARLTGLQYKSIKFNNATTRWGSCGYKDTLNFCWRLIMAPISVIDYVVVHELMHLKQKNHSYKFWTEVSKIMPDYKKEEQWLKDKGHLLTWHT
jgi:predicted metal-dependent hydrolase